MSGIRFVSLQREQTDAESRVLDRYPQASSLGDTLSNFDDNAAVISAMDLVITIDTAIAHLAGALGATTWVLLKAGADWRWLLDREDCPWYPTARLFRQPRLGDWGTVGARVRSALAERYGALA
jgi:ADP-heptose:LPS heptosyltransferase